jgi:hypothetical protein
MMLLMLNLIIEGNSDYKTYVEKAESSGYKPIGCSQQTGQSCKSIIEGVVKIRGTMIANMTKSGHHDNNPYHYADLAIKRHNLVRSVSTFAAYYFFMYCTVHTEMDSVLKRYLGNSVKADSSSSFAESTKPMDKKKDNDMNKLIDKLDGVGDRFGCHFEDQKKRFAEVRKTEATKLYVELKLLTVSQPHMANDPVVTKRIAELVAELEQPLYEKSPARKKNNTGKSDHSESDSSADLDIDIDVDSVPKVINGACTITSDDDEEEFEEQLLKKVM